MCKTNFLRKKSIYSIILIVIVLIVPIDILAITMMTIANNKQVEMAETNIQNLMDSQAKDILREIRAINREELYLCFNGGAILSVEDIDENYSSLQVSTNLAKAQSELNDLKRGYDTIDLAYFDFPKKDYFIYDGACGLYISDVTDIVRDMENERTKKYGTEWKFLMLKDKAVLISNSIWKGMSCGIILNMDIESRKFQFPKIDGYETAFLSSDDEKIISASGRKFFEANNTSFENIRNSSKYEVFESQISDSDLKLVMIVNDKGIAGSIPIMIRILQIFVVVFVGLGVPLLLWFYSNNVIQPVRKLVAAMGQIKKGNIDYRIDENSKGTQEFELLNKSFNDMIDEVQNLKIDVYERELEKKDIRMQYLSQQIQPHFILNALNVLYSYEPDEFEQSQKMIMCISKYFRYIVYANAQFVTVDAELDHIRNYFEIQHARFPDLFFSIVECDKDVEKAAIPPLILQTLVENSIKHSMKMGNSIAIYVLVDLVDLEKGEQIVKEHVLMECPDISKVVRIRIADTGAGISDEILEEIKEFQENRIPQKHLGVGIQNTIERLDSIYADGYYKTKIRFWREDSKGTNIEIKLPFYREDIE